LANQFWEVKVHCAYCDGVQVIPVERAGQLPNGWIAVIVSERLPALATSPHQAMTETVRYQNSPPYPVCSARCGALLLMGRALALCQTQALREGLVKDFQELLEGG